LAHVGKVLGHKGQQIFGRAIALVKATKGLFFSIGLSSSATSSSVLAGILYLLCRFEELHA
jgi:hypothetical protein